MKYKLKDIVTFKPGYAFKKSDMTDAGIDLVKIGNLKNNKVIIPSDVKVTEDIKFKDFIINKNDILMALTGDPIYKGNIQTWVGRTSKYLNDEIAYLNQRVCKLIPNEKIVFGDYLYYWLIRYDKTYEIAGLFHGSANQANISHKEVGEMIIDLPSMDIQRKVSKILSDIDKKINLNNEINNNLEEQLKLFFEENILKRLNDENTYECSLYDQFDVIDNRGKTPPLVEYSKYPIIDVKVLSGLERVINYNNCLKYVDKETYNTFFRSGHPKLYDTLLSTVGSLAELKIYLENIGTIAQNVVALRPKNDYPLFMYQYILSLRQRLTSYDIGSVQPSIKVTQFMKEIIKMPNDKDLIYRFENLAKANTLKMKNLMMQNRYLEQLRDTLLPKLMNGEIDLDNIEI